MVIWHLIFMNAVFSVRFSIITGEKIIPCFWDLGNQTASQDFQPSISAIFRSFIIFGVLFDEVFRWMHYVVWQSASMQFRCNLIGWYTSFFKLNFACFWCIHALPPSTFVLILCNSFQNFNTVIKVVLSIIFATGYLLYLANAIKLNGIQLFSSSQHFYAVEPLWVSSPLRSVSLSSKWVACHWY